jgi:hypothetical protein
VINGGCNDAAEMQRTVYTDEQRREALLLLAQVGKAEAARRTGIPAGTIASWGSRAGVAAPPAAATVVATEARVATIAERKARLAEGLLDDVEQLRRDLFVMTTETKVLAGRHDTDVVEVKIRRTVEPRDRNTTVQAIAKALETVQLLTGEATQRLEVGARAEPAERRQRAQGLLDELAARRRAS